MKIKIGIMGSSKGSFPKKTKTLAKQLGEYIAKNNYVLVHGATTGLPKIAANSAKKAGGTVLGISPAKNEKEHLLRGLPVNNNDIVVYTGLDFKGRNLINVRTSDIVLFICGSVGTLNEFTIAYHENKVIGILPISGGISTILKDIVAAFRSNATPKIFYENTPKKLIQKCIKAYKKQKNYKYKQ